MNGLPRDMDWTLIQSFVVVAREGSFSAAARAVSLSQPTIGRHVRELERALGTELFRREAKGLVPTDAGLEILEHAREMELAAAKLKLAADGKSEDLHGTVRITSSVVVAHFMLPQIFAEIRQELPDVQLELVPSDTTENLIFREVDIAIRMYKPTQADVIARHIGDQPTGLYAAHSYLDRFGHPTGPDDILKHDFIGFDKSDLIIRTMAGIGITVDREFFAVRCDDQAVYWQLVCAGTGIGATQRLIGDADHRVQRILPEVELPSLPYWLAAPSALRTNRRIRAVWDLLAEKLERVTAA